MKLLKRVGRRPASTGRTAWRSGRTSKLYVMNGNHTDVPEGLAADSPHRNYAEDLILPRQWDGNGHAAGKMRPGRVRRSAPTPTARTGSWCLGGFRNTYDIAFNADGELFTFDSDMEWDWGMPWYRPIRVNHCTSGADLGWRAGTGKWPDYYPDSLPRRGQHRRRLARPASANGIGAKFPAKYQKAIYVLDWTYGRLIAVHLQPEGRRLHGARGRTSSPPRA